MIIMYILLVEAYNFEEFELVPTNVLKHDEIRPSKLEVELHLT